MECTALSRREDTPQMLHARFIQRRFINDLYHRILWWEWMGRPEVR